MRTPGATAVNRFSTSVDSFETVERGHKTGLSKAQLVGDTETGKWLSQKTGGGEPAAVYTQPVIPFWIRYGNYPPL